MMVYLLPFLSLLLLLFGNVGKLNLVKQVQAQRDVCHEANDEDFVGTLRKAKQAMAQKHPDDEIENMLQATFAMHPTRAEPLYLLAKHFREQQRFDKAFLYAQAAKSIAYPEDDGYHGELETRDTYAFRFLDESGLAAFYINNHDQCLRDGLEILHWYEHGLFVPQKDVDRIRQNTQYCKGLARKPLLPFPEPTLPLKIDSTYYINLDHQLARRERMESILGKLGLSYQRFPAIGQRSKSMNMSMDDYIIKNKIRPSREYEVSRGFNMSQGEIGCFMSHYVVLQDIVMKGQNVNLVLEDDVSFGPLFHFLLPRVLDELKQLNLTWDLIMLGRQKWNSGFEEHVPGSEYLIRPAFSLGSAGYLVSAQGAAKMLAAQPLSKLVAYDDFFSFLAGTYPVPKLLDELSLTTSFDLLAVRPALLWGAGEDSDIHRGNTSS